VVDGSPPLAIRRFCASTESFSRTVLAYVSLIDFGLTAKQPFFSTETSTRFYVFSTWGSGIVQSACTISIIVDER